MILCTYRVEISEQLVISLTVAESTMEDAGEYAVRVYNEYGEVTSTTQVNIIFEAPTFTMPLTDQQVRRCVSVTGYRTSCEYNLRGHGIKLSVLMS